MTSLSVRSGLVQMELMITGLLTLVVALGLITAVIGYGHSHDVVVGENLVSVAGRTPIDTLADHLRNAQQQGSGLNYTALAAGTQTSVTYYATAGGVTVQYWKDGSQLKRTTGGTTTVIMDGLQSLSLTYYKSTTYNNNSWVTTDNPHAPTAAELRWIGAIRIEGSATVDGYSTSYNTLVRLRNSPRKTVL
jgi:hypothetical protein